MVTRLETVAALTVLLATLPAQEVGKRSFTITCFVRTERAGTGFPVLAANKDWASGEIKDYTTHHAYGSSRTSGLLSGWALAQQPGGAWTLNLGDGKRRLDYRPTAKRQRVNDGRRRMIAFSVDRARGECRLYFDGRNVAIYCIRGLGFLSGDGRQRKSAAVEELRYREGAATDAEMSQSWAKALVSDAALPAPKERPRVDSVRVLAWNIWHGGRRDGNEVGIQKTVEAIRASRADIICMQETYGSGAAIADALGYYFYLRSTNLSVMSRFPMRHSFDLYQPFRLGGVEIELSPGQTVKAFSLWINHLPSIGKQMQEKGVTPASLIAADDKTRGREIRGVLAALASHIATADETPLIVAGDFNSPSHLDWTAGTAEKHGGLTVAWPVSSAMAAKGFQDAYRVVHPDPVKAVGRTWSPRFVKSYQNRIDYVYYLGQGLRATAARMLDEHSQGWPSDHAGVVTTLRLNER